MISGIHDGTRVVHDGYHLCPTYLGQTIDCRVRIIESHWNTVVIATDLSDSPRFSITRHSEDLASMICTQFGLDPDRLLWIEHLPARADLGLTEDLYDLVHFNRDGRTLSSPYWIPLTYDEVEILTDGVVHLESA